MSRRLIAACAVRSATPPLETNVKKLFANVNVERSAPFVLLRNPRGLQIAVEDAK